MSDPIETSGRPLASNLPPSSEGTPQHSLTRRKRRRSSQSSNDLIGGTKPSLRRRLGATKEASGPHTRSSRDDMQRSPSPTEMQQEVNYTRTGRISKAKKGLKVHHCECGRSYTRAEHLRRHQKNHNQDALVCDYPECGKTFFRPDLLQRHQERHDGTGKDESRRSSVYSQGSGAEPEPPVTATVPTMSTAEIMVSIPQTIDTPLFPPVSASPMPEPTSDPRLIKQRHYSLSASRQTSAAIPIGTTDSFASYPINFTDPFSPSPNYSSSSGYASPGPGHDFINMFPTPLFGPGSNRTRTSSNASFIEPWSYPSTRSPTSATSTLPFSYTNGEKSPATHSIGLAISMATSYPTSNIPMPAPPDPMSSYMMFPNPLKTVQQRDEEERVILFPEQSFGMGTDTYQYAQYLDNYWRLFHPSFPIIHKPTFRGATESPMLKAAILAIGAQYTDDAAAKAKSRSLYDRCLKLLDQRDLDIAQTPRLCDFQSLFLLEVLSQYRARRVAQKPAKRFEEMYQNLSRETQLVSANAVESLSSLAQALDTNQHHQWCQWIDLSSKQRLLLCCYILETQQATLIARAPQPSIISHVSGFNLPLPASSVLWDAASAVDWVLELQQQPQQPSYVCEVPAELSMSSSLPQLDVFQSSLVLAVHYNYFHNPTPYLHAPSYPALNHVLDQSPLTQYHILTAQLLQHIPLRALLAVSGESWILSEKVPSIAAFTGLKTTLRTWLNELWTPDMESQGLKPVKAALQTAISLLHHTMTAPRQTLLLEPGAEMSLYYAALVLWAVTLAATARQNEAQSKAQPTRHPQHRSPTQTKRPSQAQVPLLSQASNVPGPITLASQPSSQTSNPGHPSAIGLLPSALTSPVLPSNTTSMLYSEILPTSLNFLRIAAVETDFLGMAAQLPQNLAQWQHGVGALMRWVRVRLRSRAVDGRDSVVSTLSVGAVRGEGLGELLDSVVGALEKILGRGWEGWGI